MPKMDLPVSVAHLMVDVSHVLIIKRNSFSWKMALNLLSIGNELGNPDA